MAGLRVLVTNTALAARAGSELYVRDLAIALLARGHTPVVYSPVLGDVARELRAATVPVVDDLGALGAPPDVIHGHHHLETLTALLRFPGVPAVFVCHGWLPWQESPPRLPRIRRYVAVDRTCADRVVLEHGVPEAEVHVLLNFVDLGRFAPRAPLPPRPARALVFSNAAAEHTQLPAVRAACARAGVTVDVLGLGSGQSSEAPETVLGAYDVVFAKGRAALEALAVGAAVILCDALGAGPLVGSAEFDRLRGLNFGLRALRAPVDAEHLAAELARYDPDDAARVSRRVRAEAGRDATVDELVGLYRAAIAEQAAEPDAAAAELPAVAESLQRLGAIFREQVTVYERQAHHLVALLETARTAGADAARNRDAFAARNEELAADATAARAEGARLAAAGEASREAGLRLALARDELAQALAAESARSAALGAELARVRDALAVLEHSTAIRLRDRLLAVPGLGTLVRRGLRAGKDAAARLRTAGPR